MTQDAQVTVLVDGKPVQCRAGRPVFNELLNAKVLVQTACGGQGTCFLCRITVSAGADLLPPPTAAEKRGLGNVLLAMNMRLSCQIPATAGLAIVRPNVETAAERRDRVRRARDKKG